MRNFLIIMLCVICFILGFVANSKANKKTIHTVSILHQIDSIIIDREHFVVDSINTTIVHVERIHDSSKSKVDTIFSKGTKEDKKKEFNLYYPPFDTTQLMMITEGQAKTAIVEKINHIRDSSLMVTYKKSADDADARLNTIKTKVDTVKVTVKQDVDSASNSGWKKGATTVGIIYGIIYIVTLITAAVK